MPAPLDFPKVKEDVPNSTWILLGIAGGLAALLYGMRKLDENTREYGALVDKELSITRDLIFKKKKK